MAMESLTAADNASYDSGTSNSTPCGGSMSDSNYWPWMEQAKCRLDDPIEGIDEHDKRPCVKDLISSHQSEISQVKTKLQNDPLYDPAKHDDLWVVRFVLSHGHKNTKKAAEAAKSTLQFRHDNKLDEQDIRFLPVTDSCSLLQTSTPSFAQGAGKMLACYDSPQTMIYYNPDLRGPLVGFLHLAGRNQPALASRLSPHDYLQAHLFFTEWKFQWCDYKTRTTGRLTKYLGICDCHGATQKTTVHKESKKHDAAAAKQLEDKYPQLLGEMVVMNAPKWINVVFAIVKPFLPKRLLQKVKLLQPLKKEKDLQSLLSYCQLEHLPAKYGGKLDQWPPPEDASVAIAAAVTPEQGE